VPMRSARRAARRGVGVGKAAAFRFDRQRWAEAGLVAAGAGMATLAELCSEGEIPFSDSVSPPL
jgi:hypothetical protein